MKLFSRIVATLFALPVLFIAAHILDLSKLFAAGILVAIVGIATSLLSIMIAGGSVPFVGGAANTKGYLLRLVSSIVIEWVVLFLGLSILAGLGYQI